MFKKFCVGSKDLLLSMVILIMFYCYMNYSKNTPSPDIEQLNVKTTIPPAIVSKLKYIAMEKSLRASVQPEITTISVKHQNLLASLHIRRHTANQRTAVNGEWIRFKNGVEVFGYSAFVDKRPSLGSKKTIVSRIRVIVVTTINKDDKIRTPHCVFDEGSSVKALLEPIGMGVILNSNHYREFIFSCDVGHLSALVKFVSVVYMFGDATPRTSDSDKFIPIETPKEYKDKGNIAVCVSVTYWKQDYKRVVEWVELNRLMGVSHITIYNNSMDEVSARVFTAYTTSSNTLNNNFLSLRQSHKFIHSDLEVNLHLHMSPVINDCMYRNMYRYRKIAVIDLDELIVPANNQTLYEMLIEVDRTLKDSHPARSFTFRNSYHFLDYNITNDSPLTIISHEMAITSDPGNSVKSIIDTRSCIAMHNHFCWKMTPLFDDGHGMVEVDPKFGLNQHYKKCHFDKYHGKVGECKEIMKKGEKNLSTQRYRPQLEISYEKIIKELNLN